MIGRSQPLLLAAHYNAGEILESYSDIRCRRWHPAKTPGALRFDNLALHILPHKGERHRRYVSARKLPNHDANPETHSKAQLQVAAHTCEKYLQHTASLDELAEPN
jgi:hypothetical protein